MKIIHCTASNTVRATLPDKLHEKLPSVTAADHTFTCVSQEIFCVLVVLEKTTENHMSL